MHRSDFSLFTVNLMWLNVFWSSKRFPSWFSLSAYQSVLMKLQQLYIWKTELWPCCWWTVMNVLEFCLDVKNQHCCTSYISGNQTEKTEKMRWSCAFWFCGEQKQKNQCCMARFQEQWSLRRRRRRGTERRRYAVEDVAIQWAYHP